MSLDMQVTRSARRNWDNRLPRGGSYARIRGEDRVVGEVQKEVFECSFPDVESRGYMTVDIFDAL